MTQEGLENVPSHIDQVLGDYSQQHTPEDQTGLAELHPILITTKQVYDVARMSGFTEAQAMQFARDYFVEILRHAAAAS